MTQQEAEIHLVFSPGAAGLLDEFLTFSTSATGFEAIEIPLRAVVVESVEEELRPEGRSGFSYETTAGWNLISLPVLPDIRDVWRMWHEHSGHCLMYVGPGNTSNLSSRIILDWPSYRIVTIVAKGVFNTEWL